MMCFGWGGGFPVTLAQKIAAWEFERVLLLAFESSFHGRGGTAPKRSQDVTSFRGLWCDDTP